MTEELKDVLLSENLRTYLGEEMETGNPVPEIIQDILSLPASTTAYANFRLKGPRRIQPYVVAVAAVFTTEKGPELGMFAEAPADTRQSLYYYRNLIPTIQLPPGVIDADSKRFHRTPEEVQEYQETSLFPRLQEYRFPLAMMTFSIAILEVPVDLIYLHHHSDVRAQQALDFLHQEAAKPFSGQ